MRFQTVILDLDGTILATAEGVTKGMKYAAEKMDIEGIPFEKTELFIGPSMASFCKKHLNFDREKTMEFNNLVQEYYIKQGIYEAVAYEGVIPMMRDLRAKGAKVYVCTSKHEKSSLLIAQAHGFADCHDGLVGSSADVYLKGELLRILIDKYTIDVQSAVMIGDRYTDIDGAKENNMTSIGVLYGYGSRQELVDCGSDYIAPTAADLHSYLLGND